MKTPARFCVVVSAFVAAVFVSAASPTPVRLKADTTYAQSAASGASYVVSGFSRTNAQELPDQARLQQLREYIKKSWTTLSRSNRDLPRALPDPKMPRPAGARWLLYIASTESKARVERELNPLLGAASMRQIEIRTLTGDPLSIREHGLLYLPRPYVVPGGRFNEMYGWDSYF